MVVAILVLAEGIRKMKTAKKSQHQIQPTVLRQPSDGVCHRSANIRTHDNGDSLRCRRWSMLFVLSMSFLSCSNGCSPVFLICSSVVPWFSIFVLSMLVYVLSACFAFRFGGMFPAFLAMLLDFEHFFHFAVPRCHILLSMAWCSSNSFGHSILPSSKSLAILLDWHMALIPNVSAPTETLGNFRITAGFLGAARLGQDLPDYSSQSSIKIPLLLPKPSELQGEYHFLSAFRLFPTQWHCGLWVVQLPRDLPRCWCWWRKTAPRPWPKCQPWDLREVHGLTPKTGFGCSKQKRL